MRSVSIRPLRRALAPSVSTQLPLAVSRLYSTHPPNAKLNIPIDYSTTSLLAHSSQTALSTSELPADVRNGTTKKMNLFQAINDALSIALAEDDSVMVFGEDVAFGGVFRCTMKLAETYGADRIFNTPLTEQGIMGFAIGVAAEGMRPVAEIQFADYVYPAFDQLVNEAAKYRYRDGACGRSVGGLTVRMPCGGVGHGALYHSQSPESLFTHIPGLRVIMPRSPLQAKGLLLSAIRSNDPCIFMEPKILYRAAVEQVPAGAYTLPLSKAEVLKEGKDVTIVSYGQPLYTCMSAIQKAEEELGISVELIDLRTLYPWDKECVFESVRKTGHCIVVHEAMVNAGIGAEVAAAIQEDHDTFLRLEAPVARVAGWSIHTPLLYEKFNIPDVANSLHAMSQIDTVSSFVEGAPPGEVTTFLEPMPQPPTTANTTKDIKSLTVSDPDLVSSLEPAFEKYNEEQFITVKLPGGSQQVIISSHNSLGDGQYFDVESSTSFTFDHTTQKASNAQSYVLESSNADLIKSTLKSLGPYVQEHFPNAAYGVYPIENDSKVAVIIVSNKYSPNNFWNGRWRSLYIFDPSSESLEGSVKVDVHYYEDGNVRLLTSRPTQSSVSATGAGIIKEISTSEKKYQEELNRGFASLSEGAFKGLRRQLPVTRQKIEWDKITSYRVGKSYFTGGGVGELHAGFQAVLRSKAGPDTRERKPADRCMELTSRFSVAARSASASSRNTRAAGTRLAWLRQLLEGAEGTDLYVDSAEEGGPIAPDCRPTAVPSLGGSRVVRGKLRTRYRRPRVRERHFCTMGGRGTGEIRERADGPRALAGTDRIPAFRNELTALARRHLSPSLSAARAGLQFRDSEGLGLQRLP
ncbi:transketolase [Colletotrichum plurivorum]|uniref:F-actin-capping protein subunit alpha n=1 Tax=Colletotrichum plurivorum TaxID=2175906 RepID=A0A8H6KL76_9PEZI|nr:transketolase [Colletotrichum plurivorum]